MTDILVVGAGPAGMAAAITAAQQGALVTVIDNRTEPGGNIYSSLRSTKEYRPEIWNALGSSYRDGQELVDSFLTSSVKYLPRHALWHLDPDGTASARGSDGTKTFAAGKVVLATGAQERPLPLDGWTLPGVMGVGAAQLLLKASGDLPKGPIVIVGTGPLPLLYAAQVLAIGGKIAAFVEPAISRDLGSCIHRLSGAWYGRGYLLKGLGYLARRALAKIPVYRNATSIEITGEGHAAGVRFRTRRQHDVTAKTVLLHDGVVPNVNPGGAAGLTLRRNPDQDCWAPISNEIIKVAGDAGGILGAKSAKLSGIAAAHELLGNPIPDEIKSALKKERLFRSFIDAVYPTLGNAALSSGATLICRCEAVSKQRIAESAATGGTDPNRLKTHLRCGMGPCQGRMCSLSVETIISETTGETKEKIGLHRLRNPIVPITLSDLAKTESDGC
ncbi:FAD-dependent oxidoreductase [uncultured Roseobacter sp.]|uniref:FAD-dependent oxidoreductase n=1 Tax=uncultured Roseobacter sp. TaxID=114847 RepID=UPI002617DB1C|nr:FAD-dependent oxidoreductase [uncultured Roseobacter sp.]